MRKKYGSLEGQVFGRLTVVGSVSTVNHQKMWRCVCACGVSKDIAGPNLRGGLTTSCGCYRKEVTAERGRNSVTHGKTKSSVYRVWTAMRSRCEDPKVKSYKDYGARGISVSPEWKVFENFYRDMGDPPAKLSIERKNNSLGYSKGNCRWATQQDQMNNTRVNVILAWKNQTQTLAQWARHLGFKRYQLQNRIRRGWSIERAFTTPIRKHS